MDHCQSDLDRGKLDIHSTHQQTGLTYGPAIMILQGDVI